MRTDFTSMSGPELVTAFNEMAEKAKAAGIDRFEPVQRFATRDKGITRCSTLYLALTKEGATKPNSAAKPKVQSQKANGKKTATALTGIKAEFRVRPGSKREKLLEALSDHIGKPVAEKDLLKAVYGAASADQRGALGMVMKGLLVSIKADRLPYQITRTTNDKKEAAFELQTVK